MRRILKNSNKMSVEAYACACGACVCTCSCSCTVDAIRWDNYYDSYVNTKDYLVSYYVFQVVHQFGG